MLVKKLFLKDFRRFGEASFEFSPTINWIVGENAQGKTTILEALCLLSTGRSFRTAHLKELIREGCSSFWIEAEIEKDSVLQRLAISFDGETKRILHNQTSYSHFAPIIGFFPSVMLVPGDRELISGPPHLRRQFLNVHLAQSSPSYVKQLMRYHRALKQRNALLRQKITMGIEPWESVLAEAAHQLILMRAETARELRPPIDILSGERDHLSCEYHCSIPLDPPDTICERLVTEWQKHRPKEMETGTTLIGPHRDDLRFYLGKKNAKIVASEGQKHTIAAALRLAEWQRLKEITGMPPFMAIDDFGIHLDPFRQQQLKSQLTELGQVFLSSPSPDPELLKDAAVHEIKNDPKGNALSSTALPARFAAY